MNVYVMAIAAPIADLKEANWLGVFPLHATASNSNVVVVRSLLGHHNPNARSLQG